MYSFLIDDISEHKKAKGVNRNVVVTILHGECWIRNVWDIWWIEFKVKIIEWEPMKSTIFLCLALLTKFISKAMDTMD